MWAAQGAAKQGQHEGWDLAHAWGQMEEKWESKPSQGAEFGCSQSSPESQGSIFACHTAGAGQWRGRSWRPP